MKSQSPIHRLLFRAAKQAHLGAEAWFAESKFGVTPLQFGVLRSIAEKGSTLNELARSMMLKPPSVLPSIDLLEQHGCLVRRKDPHDRRKIHLVATAKGRKLMERVVSSRKPDPLGAAFRKLSANRKQQLVSMLKELSDGMVKP